MKYLESLTQFCLAIWVGAMAGFAFTAPLLFRAFGPERQRAGDLVGQIVPRLNTLGLVLGVVALVSLLPRLQQGFNRWRAGLLTIALGLTLFGLFYIIPQMDQARPPQPIERYGLSDPIRVAYDRLHKVSERVIGAAILLGAGVIILGPLGRERQ